MQLSRQRVRELRLATRRGDVSAARMLLAHSVSLEHDRLAIRRYYIARFLGATDLDQYREHCIAAARRISPGELLLAARNSDCKAVDRKDFHIVASELLPPADPVILPYAGVHPHVGAEPNACGSRVSLLGRIEMGNHAFLGLGAAIRADGHFVRIGNDFALGEMSTVHIAHDIYPTVIGNNVAVGRNAVIHACTVGNECVVEDEAIILDGSRVEDDVVIEAGSIVFPRSILKAGMLYSGSPAKAVRELTTGERNSRGLATRDTIAASLFKVGARSADAGDLPETDVFIAATAQLTGQIKADKDSSVFFGCRLDAGRAAIVVGKGSNIQDNTVMDASEGMIVVGENTTIGHNVHIRACRIGDRSLIGIGSNLAVGTIVDDDVLLAAGSITLPGQHLERGWMWGGRPARQICQLDDARRGAMSTIVEQYREYAGAYRRAQSALGKKGTSNGTSPLVHRY